MPRPRWGTLLLLLVAVALLGRPALAGDSEMAKFLLKGARGDIDKKQYDDAVKKLEKARAEDAGLLEVAYWTGAAYEGLKEVKRAIAAYRSFVEAYEPQRAEAKTTADQDALYPKAQARIAALDAAGTEYRKLGDAYVAKLLAFAEENFVRDPSITARALRMVLELRPNTERARELLTKLGGADAAEIEAAIDPLGVKEWIDLNSADLWRSDTYLQFGPEGIVLDMHVGQLSIMGKTVTTGPRYAYEAEVRFTGFYADDATFGMTFAFVDRQFLSIMITPEKADIAELRLPDGKVTLMASMRFKRRLQINDWHRFTLAVDGSKVEFLMDGTEILEASIPSDRKMEGPVGLYTQQCRAEVRRLRVGGRD